MANTSSIHQALLENSLKSMDREDNGKVVGTFVFSPDFPAFEGHFPGQPVLPAVVQIAAARLLAEKHLNRQLNPVNLGRAKFKSMVGPDEPITITISLDQSSDDVTISFSITAETKKVATGDIICRT